MKFNKLLTLFLLTLLFSNPNHLTLNESTLWLKKIKVNIDFSSGSFLINPSSNSNEINGFIEFNTDLFQPNLDFNTVSRIGVFDLSTNFKFEFNFESNNNEFENQAEVLLPINTPIKLDMDYSLADVKINLNEIDVSTFNFDLGLGSAIIDMGEKYQKDECNFLIADVGLGSAEFKQLGNLYCDDFEIECGMGSLLLNFSGELKKNIEYNISVGMGEIKIEIPQGVNVIFEMDKSFFSDLNLEKMVLIEENIYRNESFIENQQTIKFNCSIGLGNVSLKWIK
jgi:hypothetical protein